MTDNQDLAHEAFVTSILTATDQYRESLAAQNASRREALEAEFVQRARNQESEIERLRHENHELRILLRQTAINAPTPKPLATLQIPDSRIAGSSSPKAVSPPPTLHESVSNKDLQAAYAKLLVKFQLVENNFKKAKELLERRKVEREQWASRTALLQERIDSLLKVEHGNGSGPQPSAEGLVNDAPGQDVESDLNAETIHCQASKHMPAGVNPITSSPPHVQPTPGSTQSEIGEEQESPLPPLPGQPDQHRTKIKQEPSSDSPVVVSERAVRKRKRSAKEDESSSAKIKIEAAAESSPISRMDRFIPHSDESLDLGIVAQRISTPRKRRDAAGVGSDKFVPSMEPRLPQAQPVLYAKATPRAIKPAPLTPIDANRRVSRATGKPSSSRRTQKDVEDGIGMLAEDGISYGLKDTAAPSASGTPVPKNRLDDLLNTPGVGHRGPKIPRSTARKQPKPATPRDDLLMPKPRELPFEKSARASARHTITDHTEPSPSVTRQTRSPKRREAVPPQRKSGTLRNKPLAELKLDDFKINPEVNEGVAYAFSDVVRDKSERAALPGCTDPHCCGEEFRALAISQRPNPPLTSEQRREEQRLLEEYLGDHAYKLAAMDPRERASVWIDAKTHELANKYGKHRHRYSRMRSPPGFWNADFPSTQEMEDEKREAAKRERKAIEDRRREAMRPGGRWVFRDE